MLLFDQDEGSSVCVQPVWPQADPWAQRRSVTRVVCINDNTVLTRFDTVDITMLGLSSIHHQFTPSVFECVWFSQVDVCKKLYDYKGSHIKQHSGFEESKLESEVNCELCYCSKAAKVGIENLFTTFYSCMYETERQTDVVAYYLKVLVGGSCNSSNTVTTGLVTHVIVILICVSK